MIDLGNLKMPLNAATKTFAILAKRGAGKTYTAGVFAEELSKNNIPFVVFDPIDVWWGLRLAANGKDKGLPVVVFGLEHADIPLTRYMGAQIAQAIVKENISCVISTFGMPKVAMRQLIQEFSEELLNINNTPRQVFIEEAHEFVPQRVQSAGAKCFSAVESLVVMGRNRGIGVTLINQRAATINKDVLTQLDTLLAFRNVSPQDRKALKDWVEYHSADGDFEAFMQSLPSLPTGEGWVWSPEFMGIFKKIKIRKRETFHPDREKIGSKFAMPELTQNDIQGFIAKFKTVPVKEQESTGKKVKESHVSVPAVATESIKAVEIRLKNEYESQLIGKDSTISTLTNELSKATGLLKQIASLVGTAMPESVSSAVPSNLQFWIDKAGKGSEGKVLKFLAEKYGQSFTRQQIAFAVGLSPTSGGFHNAVSKLKKRKLVIEENQLVRVNPTV